jgi:hypothetical protein
MVNPVTSKALLCHYDGLEFPEDMLAQAVCDYDDSALWA